MRHLIMLKGAWLAVLLAVPAFAQDGGSPDIIFYTSVQTYVPLSVSSGGYVNTTVSFNSGDDGSAIVSLPFGFPWFGATYGSLLIQTNGFISFDTGLCQSMCFANTTLPKAGIPNNAIFPWWDDLHVVPGPGGSTVTTHASPTEFVIQFNGVRDVAESYTINFQVRLTPDGRAVVHYGPFTQQTGTAAATASAGFEDAFGNGARFLAHQGGVCTSDDQSGCCSNSSAGVVPACQVPDVVDGYRVSIGRSNTADLSAENLTVSNLRVLADGTWACDLQGTLRNLGKAPATNFVWSAYLSTDRLRDPGDLLIAQSAPMTLASLSSSDVTSAAVSLSPPPGVSYYVLFEADTGAVVPEPSKANNLISSAAPYVAGIDLVAEQIIGPVSSWVGHVDPVKLAFSNHGTKPTGAFSYRVLLSVDSVADSADVVVNSGSSAGLQGAERVTLTVPITMPVDAPAEQFFYLLHLDPAALVSEVNENNNLVASAQPVVVALPDLSVTSGDLIDASNGVSTRIAHFGEGVHTAARITNLGDIATSAFHAALVLSADSTLSLLSDQVLCEQPVGPLAGGQSTTFDLNCALPLADAEGRPFTSGPYFLFIVADDRSEIVESFETTNNAMLVGPVQIFAPSADLSVTSVTAPSSAGAGELVAVTRTIRNLGNRDASPARYRFFASANRTISTEDFAMPFTDGGTEGLVTLAKGAADTRTELVRLPADLPAGTWVIGCLVDPDNRLDDSNRENNGAASQNVRVLAEALSITTATVLDAVVGVPYLMTLTATGASGALSWSFDAPPPSWLSIQGGVLSGVPTAPAGVFPLAISATDSTGRRARAVLVLRTLTPTSELTITTTTVGPIIASSDTSFTQGLGASGGVQPYHWRLVSGSLPSGLMLSEAGQVSGTPKGQPSSNEVVVEVVDSVGTRSQRTVTVLFVPPGSLVFRTLALREGALGADYLEQLAVENADHSALAKPLRWSLVGQLPSGLVLTGQSEVAELAGQPTAAGLFSFGITAQDVNGRQAFMHYTLVITAPALTITATRPAPLHPGQTVSVQFSASSAAQLVYSLVSGTLPKGLNLSKSGLISGAVDPDATLGLFSFVVQGVDPSSRSSGLNSFSLRVEAEPRVRGCSSTNSPTSSLIWLLVVGALAFPPSRRRKFLASMAVLALLVPMTSRAQYQVAGPTPTTYQPLGVNGLPEGTLVGGGTSVTLPFAFQFYSLKISSLAVSSFGYLAVGGSTALASANEPVPHSTTSTQSPRAFIAPWWDSLVTTNASIHFAAVGSAPNRVAIIEWQVPQIANSTTVRFQARLFETSGRIQFLYDTVTPSLGSASVGVQSDLGNGIPSLTCSVTAACASTDFPAGQSIDYFLPPDLEVPSLSVPQTGYAGVSFPLVAYVSNRGGRQATNVDVTFYLSTDAIYDASDVALGTASAATIDPGQTVAIASNAPLPATLTQTSYSIIAIVDPTGAIPEEVETNNTSAPSSMQVGPPTPDLVIAGLTAPTTAHPGDVVQSVRSVRNAGNANAASFSFSYFLSDNAVVSVSDRPLGEVSTIGSLAAGKLDTASSSLTLPVDLPPGDYWLGACVNFDSAANTFGLTEITIVNNCLTVTLPIQVSTSALTVTTSTLPAIAQFGSYSQQLAATGGTGHFSWSLSAGTLPLGLSLSASGQLSGSPSNTGTFGFDVQVASGSLSATKTLSLTISPGNLPLSIVDQLLPSAEFGHTYLASLIAVGGKPPYAWATEANLPPGLALATDGQLEGRGSQAGDFAFSVTVTDSSGATATKALALTVVTPAALSIATTSVARGRLNHEYVQPLVAVGGRAPYAWKIVRVVQLAEAITDTPGDPIVGEAITPFLNGLGLSIDDGPTADFLSGAPKQAGLFVVTLEVADGAGTVDHATVVLHVTYDEGFVLTTTFLPDAFVNQPYSVKLSHSGAREVPGVVYSNACVIESVSAGQYQCATVDVLQQLPAGLTLGEDGALSGTTTASPGSYSFLVRVRDAAGRQDVRSVGLQVQPDFKKSGCGSTTSGPSWLALGSLAWLLLWRKRRMAAAACALALSLAGCSNASNVCVDRKVTCEASLTCDPTDGVCKCGGRGGVICPTGFSCDPLANACQSTVCAAKDCTDSPGTSCDAFDGQCKCGGTGGAICGPLEQCDPNAKACVPVIDCRAVACPFNQTCDQSTGQCRCADASCTTAQTCSVDSSNAKVCVASLCTGVTCTGATVCDAATGACTCNGVMCLSGQACTCPAGADAGCAASERTCRSGNACDGVQCARGTICDPADGRCRCGGPGGPVCSPVQNCSLGPPAQCQGGEQCVEADGGPKVCTGGTSCDNEDGRCKCGGRGGLDCAPAGADGGTSPAQVCVQNPTQQACRVPCDVRSPDCPAGSYCYFDSSATVPAAYCSPPSDSKLEDSACTTATSCFASPPGRSIHCLGLAFRQTGICRAYCDVSTGTGGCVQVPRPQSCLQIPSAPTGFGYCNPM